jgi:D-alanyl-D-alanine dipeptidase
MDTKGRYRRILLAILLCGCLVACGKSDTSQKETEVKQEQADRKTVEDTESVETETEEDSLAENGIAEETEPELPEPADTDFVRVLDYIPDAVVDLKYATADNFTGTVIYDFNEAYLRYGTVKKLAAAQEILKENGYRIKIWDAYRPFSAQQRLWEVCPNPTYVANPANGMKAHNLGGTIDMTVVTLEGNPVEMPTDFDDFSTRADRDYSDVSSTAAANATMLEQVMTACGFVGYSGEWWDYSDTTVYPAVDFQVP